MDALIQIAGGENIAAHAQDAWIQLNTEELVNSTDPTKPWTAGPGSFADALIQIAGGENIAAHASDPWIQLNTEELVKSDPEIIIVDAMMGTAVISPPEESTRSPDGKI